MKLPAPALLAHRAAPVLASVVLTAAAAVATTWPLARDMGNATLRSGEVLLTAWQLNWYHHALLTNPLAWADANIFFPYDNAATFNDLLLTHALVTLPAAWAESPVLPLNLALLGGIVLCGLFAHLLIVELTGAPWAGVVGGTLFALTPFRFLHLGHVSIVAAWAIPLFFWALLRHLRRPGWGRAFLAAACGVAVGLSSLYHAAYAAPIVPLVLLCGLRRGPGGRKVWLPLLVAGAAGLSVLVPFLVPYAVTLRTFGAGSAPDDLLRYGADLSSLARKPYFLTGAPPAGIDPEAHLYPGAPLALLAGAGAIAALLSLRALEGWRQYIVGTLLGLGGAAAVGFLVPLHGSVREIWELSVLALIWIGPVAVAILAIAGASAREAIGPAAAIRLGMAGAALSFVLALGPEARYASERIGPAPYALLARAASAFEGTRVPARFGGVTILFLALAAAGTLAALARSADARWRIAALAVGTAALIACFAELPLPARAGGRELVPLPPLRDAAYDWIRDRPGRLGILELPVWPDDTTEHYEYRSWRAMRYMLASKQHGHHLVNGTGRVEPFFWHRFRGIEAWTSDFFAFIASYLPIDYVLVHEGGIPVERRGEVWARLDGGHGWRRVFQSAGIRVYEVDRSSAQGALVDRLFVRRPLAPEAEVAFSARVAPGSGTDAEGWAREAGTLELLRDGEPVDAWEIDGGWKAFRLRVPVDRVAPDRYDAGCSSTQPAPCSGWPRAGVLFRWRMHRDTPGVFEMRGLSVEPSTGRGTSSGTNGRLTPGP